MADVNPDPPKFLNTSFKTNSFHNNYVSDNCRACSLWRLSVNRVAPNKLSHIRRLKSTTTFILSFYNYCQFTVTTYWLTPVLLPVRFLLKSRWWPTVHTNDGRSRLNVWKQMWVQFLSLGFRDCSKKETLASGVSRVERRKLSEISANIATASYKASKNHPTYIHPENGNCNDCRNVW